MISKIIFFNSICFLTVTPVERREITSEHAMNEFCVRATMEPIIAQVIESAKFDPKDITDTIKQRVCCG